MRILITRHGESLYNIEDRIGGDPSLSDSGKDYAKNLAIFCSKVSVPAIAYSSTKKRSRETIAPCKSAFTSISYCSDLDEINAGRFENLTYDQVRNNHPKEFALRSEYKLSYRYPEGESYTDLFERVRPLVHGIINSNEDVFIFCHRAISRALLYHLTDLSPEDAPKLHIPLHHILSLTGTPGNMELEIINVEDTLHKILE